MKKHGLFVAIFASLAVAGWAQDNAVIVESFSDGLNYSGFSQQEGKWSESVAKSTAEGLQATKSVYNDANAEAATARFTPTLPAAGKYEVFLTYPQSGNAEDIKYKIVTADGEKNLTITQNGRELGHKPAANEWYSLGIYNFNAGTEGYVELSDPQTGEHPLVNEPNARIYADAVKFVPVDASATVTPLTDDVAATAVTPAPTEPVAPASPDGMAPLPGSAVLAEAAQTPAPATPAAATPAAAASPATVTANAAEALPTLPGTTPAAAESPALPATTPATAGLPSLPATTPALPPLPDGTPQDAATALPGLPGATPAAVADAAGLPSLPPTTSPAEGLPSLPAEQPVASPALSTPAPVTADLPSLAPVTPTPVPDLPSPSDTPVPSMASPLSLRGTAGTLATPVGTTGVAVPTPIAADAAPLPAPTGTPAAEVSGYSVTLYNPSNLQWMYDIGAAMAAARSQNKKVMVFFTAEHNKAAQAYETESFNDPAVRNAISKYVLVKVDFPRNTRLAYDLGVFGAGVIAVVDPSGTVTSRVVQRPASASELITQLASDRPVRATPTPAGFEPTPQPAVDPAMMNVATTAPATTDGVDAAAPMPGAAPAPMPGMPALPAMPAAPAAPTDPAAGVPPAATPPQSGDAAANLPGLPPQ